MPGKPIDPAHYAEVTSPPKQTLFEIMGEDPVTTENLLEALYRRGWRIVKIEEPVAWRWKFQGESKWSLRLAPPEKFDDMIVEPLFTLAGETGKHAND